MVETNDPHIKKMFCSDEKPTLSQNLPHPTRSTKSSAVVPSVLQLSTSASAAAAMFQREKTIFEPCYTKHSGSYCSAFMMQLTGLRIADPRRRDAWEVVLAGEEGGRLVREGTIPPGIVTTEEKIKPTGEVKKNIAFEQNPFTDSHYIEYMKEFFRVSSEKPLLVPVSWTSSSYADRVVRQYEGEQHGTRKTVMLNTHIVTAVPEYEHSIRNTGSTKANLQTIMGIEDAGLNFLETTGAFRYVKVNGKAVETAANFKSIMVDPSQTITLSTPTILEVVGTKVETPMAIFDYFSKDQKQNPSAPLHIPPAYSSIVALNSQNSPFRDVFQKSPTIQWESLEARTMRTAFDSHYQTLSPEQRTNSPIAVVYEKLKGGDTSLENRFSQMLPAWYAENKLSSLSGDQKTKVLATWRWMRGVSPSNIKETDVLPFIPAEAVDPLFKGIVETQERQGNRFFSTDVLNGDGSLKKDEQGKATNTSDRIYLSFLKEFCPDLFSRYNNDIVTREFLNQGRVKSSVLETIAKSNQGSHFSEQFKIAKKEHFPTFWLRQNDHLRISKQTMGDVTKFLTEGYAAFKKEKDRALTSLEGVNWEAPPSTALQGSLTQLIPSSVRTALNLPSNFPLSNNELLKVCNLDLSVAESIAIIFHNEAGGNNNTLGFDDTVDAIAQMLGRGSVGLTQIHPSRIAKLVPGIFDTVARKANSLDDPTKASKVREMLVAIRDAHVAYDAASKKLEYTKKNKPGDAFGITWGEMQVVHLREEYKSNIVAALKDPVTNTLFAVALAQDNNKSVSANLSYYNFRSPNIPEPLKQNLHLFGIATAHNGGPAASRTLMEANISLLAAKQMGIEVSKAEVSNIRNKHGYEKEQAAAHDVTSLAMGRILERMEQWQQNPTMVSGSERSLYDAIKAGEPDTWIRIKNARSEMGLIGSSSIMEVKSTSPLVFRYPNLAEVFRVVTQHMVDPTKLTDPVVLNSPEFFGKYFLKGAIARRANLFPAIDHRNRDSAEQTMESRKVAETQASNNREMTALEENFKIARRVMTQISIPEAESISISFDDLGARIRNATDVSVEDRNATLSFLTEVRTNSQRIGNLYNLENLYHYYPACDRPSGMLKEGNYFMHPDVHRAWQNVKHDSELKDFAVFSAYRSPANQFIVMTTKGSESLAETFRTIALPDYSKHCQEHHAIDINYDQSGRGNSLDIYVKEPERIKELWLSAEYQNLVRRLAVHGFMPSYPPNLLWEEESFRSFKEEGIAAGFFPRAIEHNVNDGWGEPWEFVLKPVRVQQ